jgi:RimJ/RimL family protein N-acetyltransferase
MDTFATPRLKATKLAREDLPDLVHEGNLSSERVLLKAGFAHERDAVFQDENCGVFRRLR